VGEATEAEEAEAKEAVEEVGEARKEDAEDAEEDKESSCRTRSIEKESEGRAIRAIGLETSFRSEEEELLLKAYWKR
jgi:hypothetical protein